MSLHSHRGWCLRWCVVSLFVSVLAGSGMGQDVAHVSRDAGTARGGSFSGAPQMAASGSAVYAVWPEQNASGNTDIVFNRSLDLGRTWQAGVTVLDTGAEPAFAPRIAATSQLVYVVWYQVEGNGASINFRGSANQGATWSPVAKLNTSDVGVRSNPRIAAWGVGVHVVWEDQRSGGRDVYYNSSPDIGMSWRPADVRLNTSDGPAVAAAVSPEIAIFANQVSVVWADYRAGRHYVPGSVIHGGNIYGSMSSDGGATWLTEDVKVSHWVATELGSWAPLRSSMVARRSTSSGRVSELWGEIGSCSSTVRWMVGELGSTATSG